MDSLKVTEFENILQYPFSDFLHLSNQIGGLVQEQCNLVAKALKAQLDFIKLASETQKPTDNKLMELLKPTSGFILEIISIRDKNRKDEHFNLLSSVAEGISALGWVSVVPTPVPYIKEMIDSAQFYTNKVLISYKNSQPEIANWAKLWIEFLTELQKYVKKNYTTGLVWNSKGNIINGDSSALPPPPPPPPSADFFNEKPNETGDLRAALLSSLNKGTDITKGLRKINLDQQTHKNPSLRQSGVVPDRSAVSNNRLCSKNIKFLNPKFELQGKKWIVENQFMNKNLVIKDTDISQSISVFNCNESVLMVKGKVNLITVNQCKKFSIIFDSIVSVVEFINSQRLQAQATDVVPTITVDKVDSIEIYLAKESLACEIISTNSSEINVSVQNESGDYVEHPLPEQLKSVWNGKEFETIAIEKK